MTVTRRTIIAAAASAGPGSLLPGARAVAAPARPAVRPPRLRAGDLVRVIAPAGVPDTRLARGIEILQSFGLIVDVGEHVYDTYGYLAGTDEARLADLNAAFTDR